ncbi:MAG: ribosome silencing factor [Planctomycetaceae bacterium]
MTTPRKRAAQPKPKPPEEARAELPAGQPNEFASFVAGLLDSMRAEEIVRLDVRGVTDLADEFLIATVANSRQAAAIVEACEKARKARKQERIGLDAQPSSGWVVLDYGDVVIHLFLPEHRAYYGLEHLWSDAKRIA